MTYNQTSVNKTPNTRNSSVELFRIVATFLVLFVHLNGWMAGGLINWTDPAFSLGHIITQHTIQALCAVCVNCFLIISGWYSVKLSFKSIYKLWYILIGIYVPFTIVSFLLKDSFSISSLVSSFIAFSKESYYIQCYFVLVLVSPILNSFCEKYKKKITPFVLVLWAIEFMMESLFNNVCLHIDDGYSLFHFVLIYLLGRTAFYNKERIVSVSKYKWVIAYIICSLLVCLLSLTPYKHTYAYSNPLVIAASFCLFFPFLYKTYSNKTINWVAAGTLSVYVIQVTQPVLGWLMKLDRYALVNINYPIYILSMLLFGVVFFLACIGYNKLYLLLLEKMFFRFGNWVQRHAEKTKLF